MLLVRGDWGGKTPIVAGHEAAGIIVEAGAGVTNVQPGDRVVVSLLRSCGHCYYCSGGRPYDCEGKFPIDTENRLRNQAGVALILGIKTASFAEHVVVDQSQVIKVPDDLPLDRACLLACGVITGLGAVVNAFDASYVIFYVCAGTKVGTHSCREPDWQSDLNAWRHP